MGDTPDADLHHPDCRATLRSHQGRLVTVRGRPDAGCAPQKAPAKMGAEIVSDAVGLIAEKNSMPGRRRPRSPPSLPSLSCNAEARRAGSARRALSAATRAAARSGRTLFALLAPHLSQPPPTSAWLTCTGARPFSAPGGCGSAAARSEHAQGVEWWRPQWRKLPDSSIFLSRNVMTGGVPGGQQLADKDRFRRHIDAGGGRRCARYRLPLPLPM